ncbi:MAG: excinuclease ABC subunit UvrA [Deltaproteobacteria bacterium]|nr:excinuclease ABC subunit UvrA [Deltaproteobacteria bacterium]
MSQDQFREGWIHIRGARQHNLKNITVSFPRDRLVGVSGPSGSGKSTLVFDTLYAEGQRRYVEALSPSARRYLTRLDKPDVDDIEGLRPAIAVEQGGWAGGPRSTVGTASELHDFLRLLFARLGVPHCHRCGHSMAAHTVQQMVDALLEGGPQGKLMVLAPLDWGEELDWGAWADRWRREGFARLRVGGKVVGLEPPPPAPAPGQTVELVVDRLTLEGVDRQRLTEAVELAARHGGGRVVAAVQPGQTGSGSDTWSDHTFSLTPRCGSCGLVYPEPHPRLFSFNSPHGACPACHGLGTTERGEESLVIPDPQRSLAEGAVAPWEGKASTGHRAMLEQLADHYKFSLLAPWSSLASQHQQIILHGSGQEELTFQWPGAGKRHTFTRPFEGVIPSLERRVRGQESPAVRESLRRFLKTETCQTCGGGRLRAEALHTQIGGENIAQVCRKPLPQALEWIIQLAAPPGMEEVARRLREEISARLGFLLGVGLDYLTLERRMDSVSGGEAQRIRLATQLGGKLSGVIYILDEPTIGLHPRDTRRLLEQLEALVRAGNTVVVVEHDRDTLGAAQWLVEIGPAAGEAGGNLVAMGTPAQLAALGQASPTGAYLAGTRQVRRPRPRPPARRQLVLRGANRHNLSGEDAAFPLERFVCVTGVSGSGKSSLVLDTLFPALSQALAGGPLEGPGWKGLEGAQYLDKVIYVDQGPIGASARSNPATFVGVFNLIRENFALTPEARRRGYTARRFSFNADGGRCGACGGEGQRRIEMHFLPDVHVRCEACQGTRYNRETLDVRYRGKTIADVLNMTAAQALAFFAAVPPIRQRLEPLEQVGLGYLKLGQPAPTLSGGEAQRLKIARELGRGESGRGERMLYLMDEPTTGLHFEDVERLMAVLHRLVEGGASLVVIEHNLDMIAGADWVMDLGPEGGQGGGRVVAQGTPADLAAALTHTGRALAPLLKS